MRRYVQNFISFVVALSAFIPAQAQQQSSSGQLKVLIVSPEASSAAIGPIFQTGGLAHAAGGLAQGLNEEGGFKAEILMPDFLKMNAPKERAATGQTIEVGLDYQDGKATRSEQFSVVRAEGQTPVVFLHHDNKEGQANYFDNSTGGKKKIYAKDAIIGEAMGAWAKATAEYILSQNHDLVILNDWTTGLIAPLIREARAQGRKTPKIVFAIHNMAYQGAFERDLMDKLGLDPKYFNVEGIEFWGKMNMLKAGIYYSDMVYTVSERYANEIATERFGAGLWGLIQTKIKTGRMAGILNGIDEKEWDPSHKERGMKYQFTKENTIGKALGKAELLVQMKMRSFYGVPLFVMTSRLAEQKGFEYMISAVEQMVAGGKAQFIILGDGEEKYIEQMKELERRFPEHVRYRPFSSEMEKRVTRYADFFVNGAWFEPCGLNQFFSLKNGTIPIVSKVGGLDESVKHMRNGIVFDVVAGREGEMYDREATAQKAVEAMQKAVQVYNTPGELQRLRVAGMSESHSWLSRIKTEFKPMFEYVLKSKTDVAWMTGNLRWRLDLKPSSLAATVGIGGRCEHLFPPRRLAW